MKKYLSALLVAITAAIIQLPASAQAASATIGKGSTATQSITVNDKSEATVDYASDVILKWKSMHMQSCSVEPGNLRGLGGRRELRFVVETAEYKLTCRTAEGTTETSSAKLQVNDPTFSFLAAYLNNPQEYQASSLKKVNMGDVIALVKAAEASKNAGREARSKELLLESVDKVRQLSDKGKQQLVYAERYQKAVDALIKSWPAPPTTPTRVNGGYPDKWANAPISSVIDSWGMYNRQSVSYTAFRVYDSGRFMPYWGGIGNAKQWPANAQAAGIPVDSTPQVGDVAISPSGTWGHAMYVEEVLSDGSIRVSQYNVQFDGLYSETIIPASLITVRKLVFIHFPYPSPVL